MLAIDRTKPLFPTFNFIPDIDRKYNIIYLGKLLSKKGGSEEKIKRTMGMA